MANAYAALARGGSLLAPKLVGDQEPKTLGSLNLSPATLTAILDGMKRVTSTPAGTAYYAFRDEKLPIAAKTGSAENENPDAHAWFVGFMPRRQAHPAGAGDGRGRPARRHGGGADRPLADRHGLPVESLSAPPYRRAGDDSATITRRRLGVPRRGLSPAALERVRDQLTGERVVRVRPLHGGVSSSVHLVHCRAMTR